MLLTTPLKLASYNNMLSIIIFDLKVELLSSYNAVLIVLFCLSLSERKAQEKKDSGPNNDYFYSP